jgi:hypothetical protein
MDCSSQQNRGAFQPWVISRSILRGEARRKPPVQWSYDLLGDDEAVVLGCCSVFAGGFDL